METLKVNFKKLSEKAVTPSKGTVDSAGLDLTAVEYHVNHDYKYIEFDTHLAIEIPKGFVGYIFPRSSISKTSHSLANSVGVIDSDYRGSIKLRMRYDEENQDKEYAYGDKIGQLVIMPIPKVELNEVSELGASERGNGGFGSTGN
jgi:dUTP pyrophosphatase